MTGPEGLQARDDHHRRRVRRALWLANAVVANEIAFQFGGGGFRVPSPVVEPIARVCLLALPAIVLFTMRPVPRSDAFHVVTMTLRAVGIVIVHAMAGAVALVLLVFLVALVVRLEPVAFPVCAFVLLALVLAVWMRALSVRHVVWLPPAGAAGLCLLYAPPSSGPRLEDGLATHVVEAGMQCLAADPDIRVCTAWTIVPGVLAWWHNHARLPGDVRDVQLTLSGDELLVAYCRRGEGLDAEPHELRVRVH